MSTSVKELKTRLRGFLEDPSQEADFRVWFAHALRDSHKETVQYESLAHTVQRAFSDAAEGLYSPAELMEFLTDLSAEHVPASQVVPFFVSGALSVDEVQQSEPAVPSTWQQPSNLWLVECEC